MSEQRDNTPAAEPAGEPARRPAPQGGGGGVLVGMSGGVDSTVAALLLKDEGLEVVGVTLKLWESPDDAGACSPCSDAAVQRAKQAADRLGIPHLTMDATARFSEAVIDYFVQEYRQGRTPNPCTKCNARVRFGLLVELAHQLGLSRVATGHYARFSGAARVLSRATDLSKDQSYVLAEVDPGLLTQVIFPLGDLTKSEVRRLASDAGVRGWEAPESQDICFIPDGDYRSFLRTRLGERPGEIVDQQGAVVGAHDGVYGFTIGQRKGLRVSGPTPHYVTALDPERDRVVVGTDKDSAVKTIDVIGLTWHSAPTGADYLVQIRSSGTPLRARFARPPAVDLGADERPDHVTIALDEPAAGIATGQTAVVYEGAMVVMAGTITATAGLVYHKDHGHNAAHTKEPD
ncbi:MAG: tRNA 2-thiouridine(34) synthase MnmA [Thermoleophilia bacterium]|nr:tRNA 2-thiouridine(34) synthase MnmA [Thermoleophilia bacterium]